MKFKIMKPIIFAACLAILSGYTYPVHAQDSIGEPGRSAGKKNPLKNAYFGEQHLHTSASPDAFAVGTRGTWDDAYRYGIPTPRWSTYDAKALGVDPPAGVAATIQERAWFSPIWYTPDPKLVKKAPAYPHLHQVFN
jgi:hypothetical protein